MKKHYTSLVIGMALLMASPVIANTSSVKAADTNTSAIVQSASTSGDDALIDQIDRLDNMSDSGKYNSAQKETISHIRLVYIQKQGNESDNQLMQDSYKLKDWIDRGVVGYSAYANDVLIGTSLNPSGLSPSGADDHVLTFDALNKPQMQQISFKGFTIVDNHGNANQNGEMEMWMDDNFRVHVDENYGTFDGYMTTIHVLENGDPYKVPANSGQWTDNISTVTTYRLAYLYTLEGNPVKNRGLAAHTAWYTDRYATINGQKMYRVATNEWVPSSYVN